jgi:Na+/proline symporter
MPGLIVALLLAFSLLLVHFSLRARPMPRDRPLNVDDGLPLPEVAQSSTVFSLTALFGAYYGIAVTLGLPALCGLAFGTAVGLFVIGYWIDHTLNDIDKDERTFETFLVRILRGDKRNARIYTFVISLTQLVYAVGELLILRELARIALRLRPEQATLLAIGVGMIGYFYVLFGGYLALFRTDLVQLGLLILMAVVFGIVVLSHSPFEWLTRLTSHPGYWQPRFMGTSRWLWGPHFFIAAVMSFGQLMASPDTWKRVFQVSKRKHSPKVRLAILLGVGALPYLILLPFALAFSASSTAPITKGVSSSALADNRLFAAAAAAFVVSFLSAFNGALLASVHVQLMMRRITVTKLEEAGFYWRMVAALVFIGIAFVVTLSVFTNASLYGFTNPWLLGSLLMGAYAAIAGVQVATKGDISQLPSNSLIYIFALSFSGWFVYFFLFSPGYTKEPSLGSVNSVPWGVAFCCGTIALTRLFIFGGRKYARHRNSNNQRSA